MDEPFHGCEKKEVNTLLGRVSSLMTISETMRQSYLEKYNIDSEVFHNGAETTFFSLNPKNPRNGDPIRLRFVGNLIQIQHFNAIEDIAKALSIYNKNSTRPAIFEIFGNESPMGCSNSIQRKERSSSMGQFRWKSVWRHWLVLTSWSYLSPLTLSTLNPTAYLSQPNCQKTLLLASRYSYTDQREWPLQIFA